MLHSLQNHVDELVRLEHDERSEEPSCPTTECLVQLV
jgi:hypothetical protein